MRGSIPENWVFTPNRVNFIKNNQPLYRFVKGLNSSFGKEGAISRRSAPGGLAEFYTKSNAMEQVEIVCF